MEKIAKQQPLASGVAPSLAINSASEFYATCDVFAFKVGMWSTELEGTVNCAYLVVFMSSRPGVRAVQTITERRSEPICGLEVLSMRSHTQKRVLAGAFSFAALFVICLSMKKANLKLSTKSNTLGVALLFPLPLTNTGTLNTWY